MAKVLFIKTAAGTLTPADPGAEEFMARQKLGGGVWVVASRARNHNRFRLFWALVKVCQQNTDLTISKDAWADYLKILAGHVEVVKRRDGEIIQLPKSIAFNAMSESDFAALMDRLFDAVRMKVIPGLPANDLRSALEEITGLTEVAE